MKKRRINYGSIVLISILLFLFACAEPSNDKSEKKRVVITPPEIKMVEISGGSFVMGNGDPAYTGTIELPRHSVSVDSFLIGESKISAAQFKKCVDAGACSQTTDDGKANQTLGVEGKEDHPINWLTWNDTQKFINWMNANTDETYRLCTEAEWEYAARAGTDTIYQCGDSVTCLDSMSWYKDNSQNTTQSLKSKQPNTWGVYDMIGNVYEYVQDAGHEDYTGAPTDGSAWESNGNGERMFRGAYFGNSDIWLKVARRKYRLPDDANYFMGFRVCSDLSDAKPVVLSTNPIDKAKNVAIDTKIVINFNNSMNTATVTTNTADTTCSGSIQVSDDGFSSCIQMVSSPDVSNDNKMFILTPVAALAFDTTHDIKVTTDVADESGRNLATEYTTTSGFITKPDDNTSPTVVSTNPADNDRTVATDTTISVTFDEAIDVTTVSTNTDDTTCTGSIQVTMDNFVSCIQMASDPDTTNDNKTFIVIPSSNLAADTTFDIKITTEVSDLAGNYLASDFTLSNGFYTGVSVISISPEDNMTNIALNSDIAVTFSESMDVSTITANTVDTTCSGSVQLSANDFVSCLQISGSPVASNGDKTFTFSPSSGFSFNEIVKVKITTDAKETTGRGLIGEYVSSVGFETRAMILITGGTFSMGDPSDDASQNHEERETPAHDVTLGDFYMNNHEVTVEEYKACVDAGVCATPGTSSNDAYGTWGKSGKDKHPMNYIYWDNTKEFISWMNASSSYTYRLCTEAEWEYAARAGSTTFYVCGNDGTCMDSVAWYSGNSGSQSQPVRTKPANTWGIYDMYGSVNEFVEDHYHSDYIGAPIDGSAWVDPTSDTRVYRGGYFGSTESYMRASYRYRRALDSRSYSTGFRFCADAP